VDEVERVIRAAVGAQRRLSNTSAFYLDRARAAADVALEQRLPHLRNHSRRPDHHSTHGDQLVYVLGIQVPHAGHLFHTERTNLKTLRANLKQRGTTTFWGSGKGVPAGPRVAIVPMAKAPTSLSKIKNITIISIIINILGL